MQCAAILGNLRCINVVDRNSKCCNFHRDKAKSLYFKYKHYCDMCEDLDLSINNEEHLMKCYILLNKAYNSRLKHRSYAISPEMYDDGHNHQFIKLQNLIDECENSLIQETNKIVISEIPEIMNDKENIIITIDQSRKRRKIIHEDYTQLMDTYIVEYNKSEEDKRKMISLINRNLLMMFWDMGNYIKIWCPKKQKYTLKKNDIPVESAFLPRIITCMYQLIHKLIEIDYFTSNNLDDSYRIIFTPILMKTLNEFASQFTVNIIKKIYESTLLHSNKIKDLLSNLIIYIIVKENRLEREVTFNLCRYDENFELLKLNPDIKEENRLSRFIDPSNL